MDSGHSAGRPQPPDRHLRVSAGRGWTLMLAGPPEADAAPRPEADAAPRPGQPAHRVGQDREVRFLFRQAVLHDLTSSDVFLVPCLSSVESRLDVSLATRHGSRTTLPEVAC